MIFKKFLSQSITATLVLSSLISTLYVHADPQNNGSAAQQLKTELVETEKTTHVNISREELAQLRKLLKKNKSAENSLTQKQKQQIEQLEKQLRMAQNNKNHDRIMVCAGTLAAVAAAAVLKHGYDNGKLPVPDLAPAINIAARTAQFGMGGALTLVSAPLFVFACDCLAGFNESGFNELGVILAFMTFVPSCLGICCGLDMMASAVGGK